MTNAALARKLARMNSGYGGRGNYAQPWPDPVEEQDRRRESLAEELLKIGLETVNHTVEVKVWFEMLAEAALAAAAVLYPEIPEPLNAGMSNPPAAALEGAQSVAPDPGFARGGGE